MVNVGKDTSPMDPLGYAKNPRKKLFRGLRCAEVRAISHGSYELASWALQQAEVDGVTDGREFVASGFGVVFGEFEKAWMVP